MFGRAVGRNHKLISVQCVPISQFYAAMTYEAIEQRASVISTFHASQKYYRSYVGLRYTLCYSSN